MVQTRDEAPLSTEPQASMSSDDKESTSAIMLQLQRMQEDQQTGMQQLQQNMQQHLDELRSEMHEMKHEGTVLRNELRSEMQQWRSVIQNKMNSLEKEQSTLKTQVIASITSMDKRNEQLQVEFTEQLRQKEDALLLEMEKLRGNENELQIMRDEQLQMKFTEQLRQEKDELLLEMEKLRGNDEELQIKINAQMQANADEQAQLLQQSREQEQRMEELRQETARLQGHEQQLQTHKIMLASLLQEMEKLRGNEVEHMDAAHRLEAQHKAILQEIKELHSNETLLDDKIRELTENLSGNRHGMDGRLRALQQTLYGIVENRLDLMVESFGKLQEEMGEQSQREKLRANETQELQQSLKKL